MGATQNLRRPGGATAQRRGPLNIGIAVHRYAANEGTGGYVVALLPRLARDHKVTLYAARVDAPVPAGVEVVHVPAIMRRAYTGMLTFPLGLRLVRRPHDVFHVQGWIASSADVVTAHIVLAAWRAAARRNRVATPAGERTLGSFVQAREASLIRRAGRVIAPSAKVRAEIAAHYGRSTGVAVVHHGFSAAVPMTRPAARRELGLPPDATIALFVGDVRKGLEVALDAVRQTPGVRLAVASHSGQGLVLQRAATTGMLDRLDWLGPLQEIAPAYAAADFLVHPTIYDSFGLVVAEAMSHGLPVAVTSAAGISEMLRHRETAWIIEGDSADGARAAVTALTHDANLRARLGTGARAVASQRTWDDVANETLRVYQEAVR